MVVRRASFASLLLPCLLTPPAAACPDDEPALLDLVPADAYMLQYTVADPSMDFFWDYWLEVLAAVGEARFDELAFEAAEAAGAPEQEVRKFRQLRDMVVSLVESIDWHELLGNEVVYAESTEALYPGLESVPGVFNCVVMACRVDPEHTVPLEQSIGKVMQFLSAITPELIAYEAAPEADPTDDSGEARLYRMVIAGRPAVQMAVRGDTILLGAGQELFDASLALLEGRPGESLVDTERFREAFGELPRDDSPSITYMDVQRFLEGMRTQVVGSDWFPMHDRTLVKVLDDVLGLVSCFQSVASTSHAHGTTLVVEKWTRFDPEQARNRNPLFLACTSAAPTDELLAFVPADALAFEVKQGVDVSPLYRWVLERVEKYVPSANDYLVGWELVQALGGFDVERELLPLLGSGSVSITLPSRVTSTGEDQVSIALVPDKAACQKVLGRIHAVVDVLETRVLGKLRKQLQGEGGMLPRLELRPAESSYPGLETLSVVMPFVPLPETTYGMVGNYLVSTTSDEALDYVLATAAGEHAGLSEHAALQEPGLLSKGSMVSAGYAPIGRQMQQMQQIIGVVAGSLQMGLAQAARSNPDAERMVDAFNGFMPRLTNVLGHIDFLDDEVTYAEVRDEGLVRYSRQSTRYVDPAVRAERRPRER